MYQTRDRRVYKSLLYSLFTGQGFYYLQVLPPAALNQGQLQKWAASIKRNYFNLQLV